MMMANVPNRNVVSNNPRFNNNAFKVQPSIGIATPQKGDTLLDKSSILIKWKGTGLMSNFVKIEAVLFINNNPKNTYLIVSNTSNSGSFNWNLAKASWIQGSIRLKFLSQVRTL